MPRRFVGPCRFSSTKHGTAAQTARARRDASAPDSCAAWSAAWCTNAATANAAAAATACQTSCGASYCTSVGRFQASAASAHNAGRVSTSAYASIQACWCTYFPAPRGCSTPTTRVRTCFLSVRGDRRLWRRAVVAVLPCTATVQTGAKAAECASGQAKAITGTAVSASCATGTHHTATDVVNECTAYGPQHPVAAHWSWCPIPGDSAYGKATDRAHSACLCASLSSLTAPCTRATALGCMGSACAPGTSMANRIRFACISTGKSIWLSTF